MTPHEEIDAKIDDEYAEFLSLTKKMQSGVTALAGLLNEPMEKRLKDLRVGVNSAMVEHAALVQCLIDNGVITNLQYAQNLKREMGEEVTRYENEISGRTGVKVALGEAGSV